jgi:hypothetical protein
MWLWGYASGLALAQENGRKQDAHDEQNAQDQQNASTPSTAYVPVTEPAAAESPTQTSAPVAAEPEQRSAPEAPEAGAESPASGVSRWRWSHELQRRFNDPFAGEHRHLGFSFRLGAGLGYGHARRKLVKGSSKVSGLDGSINLDFGGSVIENLIVYGRLEGSAYNHGSSGDSANAGSAFLGLIGAGARYHFMPVNVYASGTLSLATLRVTDDLGKPDNAHPGFGLTLEAGKDWWAGSARDLRAYGLGLRFGYVRCGPAGKRNNDDKAWASLALSAVFSVAYN